MTFHHFTDEQIVTAMERLRRYVKTAVLINDLQRSFFSYATCCVISPWMDARVKKDALTSIARGFRVEGLTPEDLRYSYRVLEQYGNMSSPSVMFVMRELLNQNPPPEGQTGILISFGAGFSAFAALVRF